MSQETIEIMRRWVKVFNDRDVETLIGLTTEDFDFVSYLATALAPTTRYQGHAGLRKYFADAEAAWERIQIRINEIRATNGRFFVSGELAARGRASGAEVRVTLAWVGEVRAGKVASAVTYESRAAALEAAGLSE